MYGRRDFARLALCTVSIMILLNWKQTNISCEGGKLSHHIKELWVDYSYVHSNESSPVTENFAVKSSTNEKLEHSKLNNSHKQFFKCESLECSHQNTTTKAVDSNEKGSEHQNTRTKVVDSNEERSHQNTSTKVVASNEERSHQNTSTKVVGSNEPATVTDKCVVRTGSDKKLKHSEFINFRGKILKNNGMKRFEHQNSNTKSATKNEPMLSDIQNVRTILVKSEELKYLKAHHSKRYERSTGFSFSSLPAYHGQQNIAVVSENSNDTTLILKYSKDSTAVANYSKTANSSSEFSKDTLTSENKNDAIKISENSSTYLSQDDFKSLGEMLVVLVREHLPGCALVIMFDGAFQDSTTLGMILELPNPKQIFHIASKSILDGVDYGGESTCRGYIFLVRDSNPVVDFANQGEDVWDFKGRYILAGTSKKDLERFTLSRKGTKSLQIAGITKGSRSREWVVDINIPYNPSRSLQHANLWWNGSFKTETDIFPEKISNLQGATLKVVTFEWEPSVLYYRNEDGKMTSPFGIDIEVVSAIASVLNITLQFVEPPPGELWGVATENGSWNGMVGKLSKNEADIGVANLFLTLGRLGVVDYSAPYDAEVSCFLARTIPPNPRWKSLGLPFQLNVWLTLVVGLFISGPLLFFLAKASKRCGGERGAFLSLVRAGQYTFGIHFRQSQNELPTRPNTQIFISFLWLYAIIITIAYSTNLTAFLTVVQTPSGMESIRELYISRAEVSGLGGFFKGALASSVDPYLQGLADRFEAYGDLEKVWPKVLDGKAVYLHNRQFLEFVIATQFTKKGISSVRIMKECFSPYSIAMALQRHSPLKSKFDQVIQWMLESGLVRRWFLESFRQSRKIQESKKSNEDEEKEEENQDGEESDKDKKDKAKEKEEGGTEGDGGGGIAGVIPLSIDHLQGGFFILFIGFTASFLIFGMECCI